MPNNCTLPPKGWNCSRDAGHEGPCAARMNVPPETGWLLDDGLLCLGSECGRFGMVCYTDENAIRFARERDAEITRWALQAAGFHAMARHCKPVEHQWG